MALIRLLKNTLTKETNNGNKLNKILDTTPERFDVFNATGNQVYKLGALVDGVPNEQEKALMLTILAKL